jgi:hypothetical protein
LNSIVVIDPIRPKTFWIPLAKLNLKENQAKGEPAGAEVTA